MVICTQKDKFNWNGEEQMSENEKGAKQEGPPVAKQPSVHLSVRKEDSAILEAVIDRTASQTAIGLNRFAVCGSAAALLSR